MSALTKPRNTPRRGPSLHSVSVFLKDGYSVFVGGLVALDGVDGYAVPGAKRTGLIAAGIYAPKSGSVLSGSASEAVADGATEIDLDCGLFDLDNGSSSDHCTIADVGALAYMLDDHTVSRLSSGASAAGRIVAVSADESAVTVQVGLPGGNLD